MGKIGKASVLLLTLIVVMSCLTLQIVKPANAQSTPKPSVPQFTIQVVKNGYQIDILNQPFIPNGHDMAGIFYDIRIKSHSAENWVHTTVPNDSQAIRGYIGENGQSGNTTLTSDFDSIRLLLNLSSEPQQIDFQVEAINGYPNMTLAYVPFGLDPSSTPIITVNTSGWSNSQTITIPGTSNQVSADISLSIGIVLVAVVMGLLMLIIILTRKSNPSFLA